MPLEYQIAMKPDEVTLLSSLLVCSRRYLEFGAGGSTCLAARMVADSVIAVDSSQDWLDSVAAICADASYPRKPVLVHADIGPLKAWGWPRDERQRAQWPSYHEAIWSHPAVTDIDTYMIDGRFRVACFMQVALRCRADALVIMHDFADRPNYADVHRVAREVARAGNLSAFVRRRDFDPGLASAILEERRFDPG